MEKRDKIIGLIYEIKETSDLKKIKVNQQKYSEAAELRDKECQLLVKLDEVSGVKDFYRKVYDTEKILRQLEILVNTTQELKELRPNFKEVFEDLNFDKHLVTLYKQRDEAYEAVLEIRKLMD